MTDKQIIIDGVDVSKCMFFNKNYKEDYVQIKNFCELQYISCKEFDCANCYFKKWKRKEQECEQLINKLNSNIERMNAQNEKLHNENKELKAQLEQQKKENEEFKEKLSQAKDITEPLNSELPEDKVIREIFLIVNDCINKKVNPYKQALDEIEYYINNQGINNKWNMRIQRFRMGILDIINSVKDKNVPHKAKDGEQ